MDEENKEAKKQDIEPKDTKTSESVENKNEEQQAEVKQEETSTIKKEEIEKEEIPTSKQEETKTEDTSKDEPKEISKEEQPKEPKKEIKKEEPKNTTKKVETKTFEKSKVENKKNNNVIIAIVAVVALVIIAIFAYINMADSPKKVVEEIFQDLKSGNTKESVLASAFEEENFDEETKKLLFDKLEWKIKEVKEEGDTATVKVEVINKDFKTAIGNYMQKAIKAAFSGGISNEEDATNYLMEELSSDELQTVSSEQTINLEKKDGKWQVSEENDFVNILLPGFGEALSAFN